MRPSKNSKRKGKFLLGYALNALGGVAELPIPRLALTQFARKVASTHRKQNKYAKFVKEVAVYACVHYYLDTKFAILNV